MVIFINFTDLAYNCLIIISYYVHYIYMMFETDKD